MNGSRVRQIVRDPAALTWRRGMACPFDSRYVLAQIDLRTECEDSKNSKYIGLPKFRVVWVRKFTAEELTEVGRKRPSVKRAKCA